MSPFSGALLVGLVLVAGVLLAERYGRTLRGPTSPRFREGTLCLV